jgi:hypothetical protein
VLKRWKGNIDLLNMSLLKGWMNVKFLHSPLGLFYGGEHVSGKTEVRFSYSTVQ